MATGETGFDDVTFDLISVQYHSLKAGHDYGQYVRDAENADQQEIADFFRRVMEEDSARAHQCHEFLRQLGGTDNTAPTDQGWRSGIPGNDLAGRRWPGAACCQPPRPQRVVVASPPQHLMGCQV